MEKQAATLGLRDWVVLGVVNEGRTHGFAVARALQPSGTFGSLWTVQRALVYRSIAGLVDLGLVTVVGSSAGGGPPRSMVEVTRRGALSFSEWVQEPVSHVRDARSELLVK